MEFFLPAFLIGFGVCWFFFRKDKKLSQLNLDHISLGKELSTLQGKFESLTAEKNSLAKKLEDYLIPRPKNYWRRIQEIKQKRNHLSYV